MNSDRGQSCSSAQQGHVCLMRVATKGQLVAFLFFKLTFLLFGSSKECEDDGVQLLFEKGGQKWCVDQLFCWKEEMQLVWLWESWMSREDGWPFKGMPLKWTQAGRLKWTQVGIVRQGERVPLLLIFIYLICLPDLTFDFRKTGKICLQRILFIQIVTLKKHNLQHKFKR